MFLTMKPFDLYPQYDDHVPFTISVTNKNDIIDEKRKTIQLKPGFHQMIKVTPQIVETSSEFDSFTISDRNCKLEHEIEDLKYLQKYSRNGCETECAIKSAAEICQCLPWYLPNNFTDYYMCDMFSAKCFDDILNDESYYKDCPELCLSNCKVIQ